MPELHEQDVVVVGGGLAGLTVARELRHAGLEVVVLEARERLGGRAHTAWLGGRDIELGGAHVHWLQPHVFAELTRYGIPYRPLPAPERLSYWSEGRLHEVMMAEIGPRLVELFQRLFPDARGAFPLPYQPFAVPDAVAALDALSVRDRLDATELSDAERDLAGTRERARARTVRLSYSAVRIPLAASSASMPVQALATRHFSMAASNPPGANSKSGAPEPKIW